MVTPFKSQDPAPLDVSEYICVMPLRPRIFCIPEGSVERRGHVFVTR